MTRVSGQSLYLFGFWQEMSVTEHNVIQELDNWYQKFIVDGYFNKIHSEWKKLPLMECISEEIGENETPKEPCLVPESVRFKIFQLDDEFTELFKEGSLTFEEVDLLPERLCSLWGVFKGDHQIGLPFVGCEMKTVALKTVNCTLFKDLTKTSTNAICTRGKWFTPGHIEEAAHDSCAYLASGLKLWFGARTLNATKTLVSKYTYPHKLLNLLISKPSRWEQNSFYYHVFRPGDLIIQPAFTAHAVITFDIPNTIGFITGWEAAKLNDKSRIVKVLNSFGTGKQRREWQLFYRNGGPPSLHDYILSLPSCELKTHYLSLFNAGYSFTDLELDLHKKSPTLKQRRRQQLIKNAKKT